ncbi:MAG TPA: hypothetical protein VFA43_10900 [Gemmatimonadaceae bacterium]|nr:hypothetical protein [Gemmatimonadaceae bacterium]
MNARGTASLVARLALAAGFLSAVADRFGLWGHPGAPNVSWGDWGHYLQAVALLNPLAPKAVVPTLGAIATAGELSLGVLLLIGYRLQWTAAAAAVLLTMFGAAMTFALGVKAPFDYSVFAAASAALLLAVDAHQQDRSIHSWPLFRCGRGAATRR